MTILAPPIRLLREQGETYRLHLERLAEELGVAKDVIFHNRFIQSKELVEFFNATDIYITPYLNASQITSGTLAYAFGCGREQSLRRVTGTLRNSSQMAVKKTHLFETARLSPAR